MSAVKKWDWREDLYTYRKGRSAPPVKKDFQDYIDLYFAEGDNKYLDWFLYCYEPLLNEKAKDIVQEFAMQGHFADLKQAIVFGMMKALRKYDITRGVPFLVFKEFYVKNEVEEYVRTARTGYSMQSAHEFRLARKAMAIYSENGYRSDLASILKIAAVIGKSEKDTREILQSAIDNTKYVDFYRKYADEDGEESSEDVTCDYSTEPCGEFIHLWRQKALFGAYEKLDYREREMIADHLGFCSNCYSVFELAEDEDGNKAKVFRKEKAFIDLAADHTLASPDTAFRICNGGYEKMLIELTVDDYIGILELRLKEKTEESVTYEYCVYHNNDWGQIRYAFGDDDYDVIRYVYADKKGGFSFATAGEWIMSQARRKQFQRYNVIVTEKF